MASGDGSWVGRPAAPTKARPRRLLAVANNRSAVTLQIVGTPAGHGVLANYVTGPANRPLTNRDRLYAWEATANEIPWEKRPVATAACASDRSYNTQVISFDYEDKGYIFAYAAADATAAACATVYIPQGRAEDPTRWQSAWVDLSVIFHNSDAIEFQYSVLPGYRPRTNGNWVAIWVGAPVPLDGAPLAVTGIADDAERGKGFIAGLDLAPDTTYSVGYFMRPRPSGRASLAAWVTFETGSYAEA